MKQLRKTIRGILLGLVLSELTFSSWLIDPSVSPIKLLARPAYAQQEASEGDSDPLDPNEPPGEGADPTLTALDDALSALKDPVTREGKFILDPRDGAILRAHLDPQSYTTNTSNVSVEDETTFKNFKQKLTELGFEGEQGVAAVLQDKARKDQVLELVSETGGQVFTDRSRVALTSLERLIEEGRDATEVSDFLEGIVFASNLPGEKLVEKTKQNFPLDRRVVDALAWLITPRSQGGGGHERIKVARIWKNYTARDPKSGKPIRDKTISKETEGADNVSLHAQGQAFDISEIETIKCSKVVVKKGIIRRKVNREKLPAKPIKVSYQTDEGVAKEQPPGLSFNELVQNLMQTALLDTLSEFDVTDLGEEGELRYASLQDLADFVGRSLVEGLIGGKGLNGTSMRESIELFGRAALADRLGLPRAAIEGEKINEIETSVGRFTVEQKLGLPSGSLRGVTSQEILTSVGRRQIESQLGLRDQTLRGSWNSRQALEEQLGQAMIETKLKLPLQSFSGNDVAEVQKRIGERKFKIMFASSPNAIDELVGLPFGQTSALLLLGRLGEYKRAIGAKMIADNWDVYRNYDESKSKIDQGYGTPQDTMKKLASGDQSAFLTIGRETLARSVSTNDYDQSRVRGFFDDPNLDWQLPERTIMTLTGFRTNEFARVFSGQGGQPIFERIGKSRLIQAVRNTPEAQRQITEKEQELYAQHPEILEARGSFEFRKKHLQDLQNRIGSLDRLFNDASSNPAVGSELNTVKSSLNEVLRKPLDFRSVNTAVKKISKSLDTLSAAAGPIQKTNLKNQIEQELAAAYQDIEAIVTGELTANYDAIRLGDINPAGPGQRRSSGLISVRDLIDWTSGKRLTKDLVLSVGSRQVENSLELPPRSIFYTLKDREQSPETFFRAVGRAQYEQYFGSQNIRVALAQNPPERIDTILGIGTARRSISARLAAQELTPDQYFERVGKEVLLLRGVNLLGINVEFGGLSFTPYDIYNMLSGNGRGVFERVAAQKFEQTLDLPQSVFYQLLHAPSSDDKRLAMADVASHYFGNLLGIGALPIFGVPEEVQGRYAVEATLGLQPGTFRDSLDKVIERNQPINFTIAFQMVDPASSLLLEGYDAAKLQQAIEVLSLPQTLTTVHPQQDARQYLNQLNGDPLNRNTGAWGLIEQFRRGEVSKTQLEGTVEQVDEKLRLEIGTTEKLLNGQLSLADYAKKVGGFSITDTVARSPALIDRLADVLGLEGIARDNFNSQFPIVFDLLRRNSVTDFAAWRPEDRQSFYSTLDTVLSLRFDSKLGVRRGTFALIASQPDNARKVFLTEAVFKVENQFGLNNGVDDGPLTRVYNAYANADKALKNQSAMQQAETELSFAVQREVFERTADRDGGNGIAMPLQDVNFLIHGDMRFLGLVAAADMAGSLNKDRNGNILPIDRQITYQVIADAYRAPPLDEARLAAFLEERYDSALGFVEEQGITDPTEQQKQAKAIAFAELEAERSKIRSDRKNDLQFSLIDNQLYKADINIPSGFARAMFEGTTEGRTRVMLNYVENLINNHDVLGVQLPRNSLVALEKYIQDRTDHNFDNLVSTGVLGTFDEFMIAKKLFGDFWRPGTTEALVRFGKTGALGNISTPGTIVGIYGQWALVEAFGFMDSKMGWQVGNAAQIYFATQNFLHAKAVFAAAQAADALGESTQLANSSGQMQAAAAAMITIVVSIVFAKQIGQVEQAIGLVPGTGAILLGMGIAAALGAALNPITLGLFIALNLFGFNKVKIFVLCTGDGYYPQLESVNPELTVGLPEFNGMSATEYRAGLKQAAQTRVNGLISDMMEMSYYFAQKNFVAVRQREPDFSEKVVQIITARQEDLLAFFGTERYKQVFNEDPPSNDNRQGISISPLTTEYVHIGF